MAYSNIDKPNQYFNTLTWTGDSTTPKNIEGVGFQPDLIWGKIRSQSYEHQLYDTVRGFGNDKELQPSSTSAEGGSNTEIYGYLSGVTSDGFTAVRGTDPAGDDYWNESPETYVAWNWLAGGTASSNTDGDITSSVSANTTSGFSIVSYTSNGSASQTVGHGLGVAPNVIISKNRTDGGGTYGNWVVYHSSLATANDKKLLLNSTAASSTTNEWGDTDPTSTVYSVHTSGDGATNHSTDQIVAYCFAEKKGFSKFGSYTGNGSADGPFIYTGFKPSWVLVRNATDASAMQWVIHDNKRSTFNVTNKELRPDSSEAEVTQDRFDFLSNGFKVRNSSSYVNRSGETIIYMAFAESPLVGSNLVPNNAR